jgi:hypothetical protein
MYDYDAPVFPPNAEKILARISEPLALYHYDWWNCDQAAQVLSGISGDAFNQADADNFESFSKCLLYSALPSSDISGNRYFKPLDVIKWAIARDFEIPNHVLTWYEEKICKLHQKQSAKGKDEKPVTLETNDKPERELKQGLREIWEKEDKPTMKVLFPDKLKKYINIPGSPVTGVYTAGKDAGISYKLSTGTTGSLKKKTLSNYVSEFKKTP